jgi:uncharacterized membrane protein YeaQ/YmgE (transglycosylase-associated protein family)
MSLVMFALWVFAGLLAGLVAGFVVNRGGYGLRWDIVLGLVGSIVGGAIYRALGIPPDAGMVSTVIVAILAAAGVIAGQRTMWPTVARDCVIQSRTWARFVRRTACRGCPALTWRSFWLGSSPGFSSKWIQISKPFASARSCCGSAGRS